MENEAAFLEIRARFKLEIFE